MHTFVSILTTIAVIVATILVALIVDDHLHHHVTSLVERWHQVAQDRWAEYAQLSPANLRRNQWDSTGQWLSVHLLRRLDRLNLQLATQALRDIRRTDPLLLALLFLTERPYATRVMGDWFDRVSQAWCHTAEEVAEGAKRLTYYDDRLSLFAVRRMLAFRTRARLTLLHLWLFGCVDRLTLRLGLAGQPPYCQHHR